MVHRTNLGYEKLNFRYIIQTNASSFVYPYYYTRTSLAIKMGEYIDY